MGVREFKPKKEAFVYYAFLVRSFYISIFLAILYVIITRFIRLPLIPFVIMLVLLCLINFLTLSVRYRKERYLFLSDKIEYYSGGIFWDTKTELVVRNITHVSLTLPFLEYKLFKTGNMSIESAGGGVTEVYLSSLQNSQEIYKLVEQLMHANGFKLSKARTLQEERPNSLGVFFEVFKNISGIIFTIFIVATWIGSSLAGIWSYISPFALLFGAGVLAVILFLRYILLFLDLQTRVYTIYESMVTYAEGFLTKTYAFIPLENLSDSLTTQTIVDRLLGLYDVTLSCQGSGQEIVFKNMEHGPQLEATIDKLIAKTKPLVRVAKISSSAKTQQHATKERVAHTMKKDTHFTSEFRIDPLRTFISYILALPLSIILFFFLPVWFMALIATIAKVVGTRYIIKPNSMEERYSFLTSRNKEFTNDKVTAVIFKESIIDQWFGTCSIVFWSIGSSEELRFMNIKKLPGLYEEVLAKFGMRERSAHPLYEIPSHFSFLEMLKANLPGTIVLGSVLVFLFFLSTFVTPLFVLPLLVILFITAGFFIYRLLYYQNSRLSFYNQYLLFTRGLFIKEWYYVLPENVKDVTTLKYPFSQRGRIFCNVGGERIVQQGEEQRVVSNGFAIRYVEDIPLKNMLLDRIFLERPSHQRMVQLVKECAHSPNSLITARPALANAVIPLFIASIILFPFAVLLPLTVPLTIWSIRRRTFFIEPNRLVARSGIVYRKQVSILFKKVDHISVRQGFFNKLFKNGTIVVNTVGSSKAEMTIHDIPNYKEFYALLQKYY